MLGTDPTYRAMLAIDIEKSAGRGDPALLRNREVLAGVVADALARAGIARADCHHTDLGDGLLLVVGPDVRKVKLVHPLVPAIADRLRAHNLEAAPRHVIRVRMALHAGDVHIADGAVAGGSMEDLARLLDAPPLRRALAAAPETATVALAVSQHLYSEVVRHGYAGIDPATFVRVEFTVKETTTEAWVHLPGHLPDRSVLTPAGPTGDPDRKPGPREAGQTITAQYVNLAQDGAQVGEQIGSISNRIDHVHLGPDRTASPDPWLRRLAEFERVLVAEHRAGRLDPGTYEAALAELHAAGTSLSRPDRAGGSDAVLALKRLRGLVDDIADLSRGVAAMLDAVRGGR